MLTKALKKYVSHRLSAERTFIVSFAATIVLGAILLWLPWCTVRSPLSLVDALFTSASAVCVTGLSVITIGQDLSPLGQAITAVLFQIGGLGITTFSAVFFVLLGGGLATKERDILRSVYLHTPRRDLVSVLKFILFSTLIFEGAGAAILWVRFSQSFPPGPALFIALYHAVSAFNNCGYSVFSNSLMDFQGDLWVNLTVMGLIVAGGIGFIVHYEGLMFLGGRLKRLSIHSKIVLLSTAALIGCGAVLFLWFEHGQTLDGLPWKNRMLASFFQSVTARTAGFNTVDIGALTNETLLLLMMLMFIGAAPGSTAGGVKTTTASVLFLLLCNRLRGREDINVFNRTIPRELTNRTISILLASGVSIALITSFLLLSAKSALPPDQSRHLFVEYLFETISAFGTVGLSMNLTPTLNIYQKLAIIAIMFAGRVGPLTLAFSLARGISKRRLTYAEEGIMVG